MKSNNEYQKHTKWKINYSVKKDKIQKEKSTKSKIEKERR